MKYDLSIIVATTSNKNLSRVLNYIDQQSINGITYELIIIQEGSDRFSLNTKMPLRDITIKKQELHRDFGAAAHDEGIRIANGEYLVFWDDDNLYYPHALVSQYLIALGHDLGIVKTRHLDLVIPTLAEIESGDIDTMCLCVKRELAIKEKWVTNTSRYSDFRWIMKLLRHNPSINRSNIVIGHHL